MRTFAKTLTVAASMLLSAADARAIDIDGVWISNPDVCSKVLAKRGNTLRITDDADRFGSGFIIEGNRIRGKVANCTIKTRKEEGEVLHLLTVCSTDVALQNMQFSVKAEGADRIVRIYPGIPELNTPYHRCRF